MGAVAQHLAQQPLFTVYGWKATASFRHAPPVKMRLERSAERDKREIKIIFPLNMRRATRSAFKIVYPKTDTRRTHGTFEDRQYHPAPPGGVWPDGRLYGCTLPPPDGPARCGLYGERNGVQPGACLRRPQDGQHAEGRAQRRALRCADLWRSARDHGRSHRCHGAVRI